MIALAFTLGYAGFLALCLSMSRHQREIVGRTLPESRAPWLRLAGWALLLASFAASATHGGVPIGAVRWCGLLTAAALFAVLMLSYAPRRMLAAALLLSLLSLPSLIV
ncbi:DUF3325 domain-containing protein [Solimonas soli]|uniref:DUF3325 domain-containing protein n=1 Tax=Solimonas soli TaxID=413479 RepID=UPI0004B4BB77|nr:DUF3325 domain-containing protein [Solimonas soli]